MHTALYSVVHIVSSGTDVQKNELGIRVNRRFTLLFAQDMNHLYIGVYLTSNTAQLCSEELFLLGTKLRTITNYKLSRWLSQYKGKQL